MGRRNRWSRLLAGAVVLGLAGALVSWWVGWPVDVDEVVAADGTATESTVAAGADATRYRASPSYDEVIEQHGYPHTWWVADGVNTDGQPPVRAEQWFYPDEGVWIWFIDGWRGPEEYFTPEDSIVDSYTDVTPTDLNRSMSLDEVDLVIGAERQPLPPVTTEIGDLETWAYPQAGLLVQVLDGRFFSAQTI